MRRWNKDPKAWQRFRPDKVWGFREGQVVPAAALVSRTLGPETRRRFALARLWRDWRTIVDPFIAEMVRPLSTRKQTLVLGAQDSLVMQEIHFLAPEILNVVNRHLGEEIFDKVVFELISGKIPLDRGSEPKGQWPRQRSRPLKNWARCSISWKATRRLAEVTAPMSAGLPGRYNFWRKK